MASSTTGCLLSAERAAVKGELPEDVGLQTAELLLEEVAHGGCVDTSHQVRKVWRSLRAPSVPPLTTCLLHFLEPGIHVALHGAVPGRRFEDSCGAAIQVHVSDFARSCASSVCTADAVGVPPSVQYLRHLRDFYGITFKIVADQETKTVELSCLGIGFKNMAKKVT